MAVTSWAQARAYLNEIRSTTILTAASTSTITITNTATPASRPGSRDSSAYVQKVYNIFWGELLHCT